MPNDHLPDPQRWAFYSLKLQVDHNTWKGGEGGRKGGEEGGRKGGEKGKTERRREGRDGGRVGWRDGGEQGMREGSGRGRRRDVLQLKHRCYTQ